MFAAVTASSCGKKASDYPVIPGNPAVGFLRNVKDLIDKSRLMKIFGVICR
jgi:hypothetical protein